MALVLATRAEPVVQEELAERAAPVGLVARAVPAELVVPAARVELVARAEPAPPAIPPACSSILPFKA